MVNISMHHEAREFQRRETRYLIRFLLAVAAIVAVVTIAGQVDYADVQARDLAQASQACRQQGLGDARVLPRGEATIYLCELPRSRS